METKARAASLKTFHALQASDMAAAFNDALKRLRIQPGDYAAELTEPEGPSTAGGVQAMQHLRLVAREAGYPTLLVGHANHAAEQAEIRTFDHLDAVHRQRYGKPLAIDRTQYDEFLLLAKQLLDVLHLKTTIAGPPVGLEIEDEPPPRSSGRVLAFVVALVLVLVAAGAWRLGYLKALARAVGHG